MDFNKAKQDLSSIMPPDYLQSSKGGLEHFSKTFFTGAVKQGHRIDVVRINGRINVIGVNLDDQSLAAAVLVNQSEEPADMLAALYAVEIAADIVANAFTADGIGALILCKTFSELHDFCDANCLGGCCEDGSWWSQFVGADDIDILSAAQDAVDGWLRQGLIAKYVDALQVAA